jgi:putative FmdB family regulatory protein
MPIYEFRCLNCSEYFEWILKNSEEEVELCCPKCNSVEFEKVISSTSYVMGGGKSGVKSETKSCSSGTCTTWDVPGPSR